MANFKFDWVDKYGLTGISNIYEDEGENAKYGAFQQLLNAVQDAVGEEIDTDGTDFWFTKNGEQVTVFTKIDCREAVTADEAQQMVLGGELEKEFEEYLERIDRAADEWDFDDLGDFMREQGFETIG